MIHYGFIESIDLIFRNFSDKLITFGLPDSYPNTTSRSLYKKLICRAMSTYGILNHAHSPFGKCAWFAGCRIAARSMNGENFETF